MALTAKPTKNIDLSKIDDIQNEFFGQQAPAVIVHSSDPVSAPMGAEKKGSTSKPKAPVGKASKATRSKDRSPKIDPAISSDTLGLGSENRPKGEPQSRDLKIEDLIATATAHGVRYTTRPYTVPRSLTIDLNRLKSMFRTRELQYTQAELMEKMLRESLETVTENNYHDLREQALSLVKFPEQFSRRSVTLTEDTFFKMSELKADLTQAHGRRFSNDELLTMLLAVAFAPLYEQGLL